MRLAASLVLLGGLFSVASRPSSTPPDGGSAAPVYRVCAIRYATIAGFPKNGLVAGADSGQRTDIAMMVWLAEGGGRTVLFDAGFYRDKFGRRWKPVDFVRPSDAVALAGVPADQVTDVVISHVHWDHLDGADLFPNARIWIQRQEFDYYTDSTGAAKNRTIDPEDAQMLGALYRAGRVHFAEGDSAEVVPGIVAFLGGKHTYASQFLTVQTRSGTVVLASDNAYLYENLERHVPIAQTLDRESNLAAQARMLRLASDPRLIVPGHDPLVFVRFQKPGNGVADIE